MGILASITALVELLKKVGLIRDRQAEADTQAQFLGTTSGPIYAIARVIVIYASLWDIFLNQAKAWIATGLPPILEYLPIFWLFVGPAIVPFAEAALKQGLSSRRGISTPPGEPEAPQTYRNFVRSPKQPEKPQPVEPNTPSPIPPVVGDEPRDRVLEGLEYLRDFETPRDE